MFKWCVPNKEQAAFCRMGLHSLRCRRMYIPQNAFDKYRNKILHKDCGTPQHYLWLRKFLRCRLGEIWKDTVRKYYPFLDYTLCILFLKYLSQALMDSGCWAERSTQQSEWMCLGWCSWWFCCRGADITGIWNYTDSGLHVLQGWQDLPLWQG